MENIINKLKTTKLLAAIGIVALVLGTFFTYVKYSIWGFTTSLSLFGYWEGKVILLLALANLLLIFKEEVKKYIPALFNTAFGKKIEALKNTKYSLVPTILSVLFMVSLHNRLEIDTSYATYGLGFYLLWAGSISLVAYAIIFKNNTNK